MSHCRYTDALYSKGLHVLRKAYASSYDELWIFFFQRRRFGFHKIKDASSVREGTVFSQIEEGKLNKYTLFPVDNCFLFSLADRLRLAQDECFKQTGRFKRCFWGNPFDVFDWSFRRHRAWWAYYIILINYFFST